MAVRGGSTATISASGGVEVGAGARGDGRADGMADELAEQISTCVRLYKELSMLEHFAVMNYIGFSKVCR